MSYRTPKTRSNAKEYPDEVVQKEVAQSSIIPSHNGRRENAYSHQFYTNKSVESKPNTYNTLPEKEDDNIRIYVDQWDSEHSEKKYDEFNSSNYLATDSIDIQTAKNSPLESNRKERDYESSEKYSMTSESAEKNLSGFKQETSAFEYRQQYGQVKRNLQGALQQDLESSIGHDNDLLSARTDKDKVREYPNFVSPVGDCSPSGFDDTK